MADDRFGDLGEERPPLSAAERLAAGDEAEMAAARRAQEPKRGPSSPYAWVVGIVFLIAISAGLLNVIGSEGTGARGLRPGAEMPVFAAPLATGKLEGDANIDARKACGVRGPDVLNLCDLRRRPTVIGFMFTRFADCEPFFDRLERLQREFPDVAVAGVIVSQSKRDAAATVRRNRWTFPVAYDRDGAVSNVYAVAGCPTTVLGRKGGKVFDTRVKAGAHTAAGLRAAVRRLVR